MKKQIFAALALLMVAFAARAQTPALFKYQSIVRDDAGAIIANQDVSFELKILAGAENGNSVYTEEHNVATNAHGLVNLVIGNGIVTFGNISDIDWASQLYFLQIAIDVDNGADFVVMGTSQLLSVPYALHAKTVEIDQVDDADADPSNEIQDLVLDGTILSITRNSDPTKVDLSSLQGGNTDEQTLELQGTVLSISNGNDVELSVIQDGFEANTDGQNLAFDGSVLKISGGNAIDISGLQNDADADATNEIQDLSLIGTTLSITNNANATNVDLSVIQDGFEANTDAQNLSLDGVDLNISGGNSVDLSSIQDGVNDADADVTNEIQDLSLDGSTLTITNNADATEIDLSQFQGDNTDEQTLGLEGNVLSISNGNNVDLSVIQDGVDDADADVTNEIQDLALIGTTLNITNNANATDIDLSVIQDGFEANTDAQSLSLDGSDLNISGGNTVDLSSLQDGVEDADADASNEIQDLSLDGFTLTITNNADATEIDLSPFQGNNTDEQTLGLEGNVLTISNGNNVDLSAIQDGFEANTDAQSLSIDGTDLNISGGNSVDLSGLQDGVEDADADATNEIQDLTLIGTTLSVTNNVDATDIDLSVIQDGFEANTDAQSLSLDGTDLNISGGNSVDLSSLQDGVEDADADAMNEIQDLSLNGSTLTITNNVDASEIDLSPFQGNNTDEQTLGLEGNVLSISNGNNVDLSGLQDGVEDADADATNEIQDLTLIGTTLSVTNNVDATDIDLSVIQDGFEANTDAQSLSLDGTDLNISGGNSVDLSSLQDGVEDADADAMNEIQDLSLNGSTLTITNNVDASEIDLSPFQGNNTDEQTLGLEGNVLSISNGNNVDLSGLQDGVEDEDADATNEIQDLTLIGTTLSVTNNADATDIDLSVIQDGFEANTDAQSLSLDGTDLNISGGNSVDLSGLQDGVEDADSDATNEIQDLSLVGTTLSVTNNAGATDIDLSVIQDGFEANTDAQNLSLDGTDLNISGGNAVDLSSLQDGVDDADADASNEIQDLSLNGTTLSITNNADATDIDLSPFQGNNTDEQTLGLDGNMLSISNGNNVDLSAIQDGFEANTDAQDLSLVGNSLALTNDATNVDLSGYMDNTDAQTLSFNGTNVSITGGNSVDISSISSLDLPVFSSSSNTTIDNTSRMVRLTAQVEVTLPAVPAVGQILYIIGPGGGSVNPNGKNFRDGPDFLGSVTLTFVDMTGGAGVIVIVFDGFNWNFISKTGANENQTLSLQGSDLSISNGNSIDVSSLQVDEQDLTLNGNTLALSNDASTVDLGGYLDNTDNQGVDIFSLDGTTLSLSLDDDGEATQTVDLGGLPSGNLPVSTVVQATTLDASSQVVRVLPAGITITLPVVPALGQVVYIIANSSDVAINSNGKTLRFNGFSAINTNTFETLVGGSGTIGIIYDGNSWRMLSRPSRKLSLSDNSLSLTNDLIGIDLSGYLDNTDAQGVDVFNLDGTTLSLSLDNDGEASQTVDLSSLGGADDQTIDAFMLSGTTLSLSLEGDGEADQTVDLSSLQDGFELNTDEQTLSVVGSNISISGGNTIDIDGIADNQFIDRFEIDANDLLLLSVDGDERPSSTVDLSDYMDNTDEQELSILGTDLSISNGNTVDLSSLQGGMGTDNQTIDQLFLTGTTLSVSLENDGESAQTVNLAGIQDGTGTDDQTIDVLELSGHDLLISLEGDGEVTRSVDLQGIQDGTGTDDQNIDQMFLSGNTLSISLEGDGQVPKELDLSPILVESIDDLSDGINDNNDLFLGAFAGVDANGGGRNTGIGNMALSRVTTGQFNIGVGYSSQFSNLSGSSNISLGTTTLNDLTTGSDNIAIGSNALEESNGDRNVAIGVFSANDNRVGVENVVIGTSADGGNRGSLNTIIGYQAGASTGVTLIHDKSGSVMIGYRAGFNEKNSNRLYIENSHSTTPLIGGNFFTDELYFNGNVGVGMGNISATEQFQVGNNGDGTVAIANAWNTFSDRRWKKNIRTLDGGLGKVMALRGVTYNWKSTGKEDLGFIAQEVEEILPLLVKTGESGYKSVDYARVTAVLVEAVKELKDQIDDLNNENKLLNKQLAQLDELKKEVKSLSNILLSSKKQLVTTTQ